LVASLHQQKLISYGINFELTSLIFHFKLAYFALH
jgi:hypothetical protein